MKGAIFVELPAMADAELPGFDTVRNGTDDMGLPCRSPRPLANFRAGLIDGCIVRVGKTADIARTDRESDGLTVAECRIRTGRGA